MAQLTIEYSDDARSETIKIKNVDLRSDRDLTDTICEFMGSLGRTLSLPESSSYTTRDGSSTK